VVETPRVRVEDYVAGEWRRLRALAAEAPVGLVRDETLLIRSARVVVRGAQACGGPVRRAERADFSFALKRIEDVDEMSDRSRGVVAVEPVEVDHVGAERAEAAFE